MRVVNFVNKDDGLPQRHAVGDEPHPLLDRSEEPDHCEPLAIVHVERVAPRVVDPLPVETREPMCRCV